MKETNGHRRARRISHLPRCLVLIIVALLAACSDLRSSNPISQRPEYLMVYAVDHHEFRFRDGTYDETSIGPAVWGLPNEGALRIVVVRQGGNQFTHEEVRAVMPLGPADELGKVCFFTQEQNGKTRLLHLQSSDGSHPDDSFCPSPRVLAEAIGGYAAPGER